MRLLNRTRPQGWLPPSVESRVNNLQTWLNRSGFLAPITSPALEVVKFDTQLLENPEIAAITYQQGTLAGYEVHEYLLENWGASALTADGLQAGSRTHHSAAEFGFPDVQAKAKRPLKDAAMNAIRWRVYDLLKSSGLPVVMGTGGADQVQSHPAGLSENPLAGCCLCRR